MQNNKMSLMAAIIITAIIVGGGVYFWKNKPVSDITVEKNPEVQMEVSQKTEKDIFSKIEQALANGKELLKTDKPSFPLPENIHEAQIDQYYLLGDVFMALVRKPSSNVQLNLPADFNADFAGIIAADNDNQKWEKILTINDLNPNDKNNPYAIWTDGGYSTPERYLFLTIVDQNGAGSGEGVMKLLTSNDAENWNQNECYYFGENYNGPKEDGDYFGYSAVGISEGGAGFKKHSGKECNNFEMITN